MNLFAWILSWGHWQLLGACCSTERGKTHCANLCKCIQVYLNNPNNADWKVLSAVLFCFHAPFLGCVHPTYGPMPNCTILCWITQAVFSTLANHVITYLCPHIFRFSGLLKVCIHVEKKGRGGSSVVTPILQSYNFDPLSLWTRLTL